MSYVAIREVTPASGKEAVLQERMLRLSGVMTRLGAKSGLFKVVAGDGAGRFDLQNWYETCLLYTSPSPRDRNVSRMPSSA